MRKLFSSDPAFPLDALEYLPCSSIHRFRKGELIYGDGQPPAHIHLVLNGSVKVFRLSAENRPVTMNVYGPEEIFGESALLRTADLGERAVAREATEVMKWTPSAIEGVIMRKPELGIALGHILAQRLVNLRQSAEGSAIERPAERSVPRTAQRAPRVSDDRRMGFEERPLTAREREVVSLIALGLTNREIAGRLFIGQQTVKNHIHSIFGKLGVSDRLQLALYKNAPVPMLCPGRESPAHLAS